MTQAFFIIIFILMLPMALISLAFASRHARAIIWNGFWYLILGEVASLAFKSPDAKYVGLAFFVLYLLRIIKGRPSSIRFQIHQMKSYGPRRDRPAPRMPTERDVTSAEVIET